MCPLEEATGIAADHCPLFLAVLLLLLTPSDAPRISSTSKCYRDARRRSSLKTLIATFALNTNYADLKRLQCKYGELLVAANLSIIFGSIVEHAFNISIPKAGFLPVQQALLPSLWY
jgi:hypothetical protein